MIRWTLWRKSCNQKLTVTERNLNLNGTTFEESCYVCMIEAIVWYQHLFPHTYRSRRRPRGVKKRFNKKGFPSGFPRLPLLGSCFLDNCFDYDLRKGFVGVFGLQLFRQIFRNPQFSSKSLLTDGASRGYRFYWFRGSLRFFLSMGFNIIWCFRSGWRFSNR